MCKPDYSRISFGIRGAAKGWSAERIERAWQYHINHTAKEDALAILAEPEPLRVGDRCLHPMFHGLLEVVAINEGYAWGRHIIDGKHYTMKLSETTRAAQ